MHRRGPRRTRRPRRSPRTSRPSSRGRGHRRRDPASRRRARPRRRRAGDHAEEQLGTGSAVHPAGPARLREGLDRAVGSRPRPHAEIHLGAPEQQADQSPRFTARCRPSTLCSAPLGELTGSGAESTTVTSTPPSSPGRRTAILGWSVPAILLAYALAETSTRPRAPPPSRCAARIDEADAGSSRARRGADEPVGRGGHVERPELARRNRALGADEHAQHERCREWEGCEADGHAHSCAPSARSGHTTRDLRRFRVRVFHHVGERLGDHEVGARLDLRCPVPRHSVASLDLARCALP